MTSKHRAAEAKQTVEEMRLEISHPTPLFLLPCVTEAHLRHTAWSPSWHLTGFTGAATAIQHHFFHLNSGFTGSLGKPRHPALLASHQQGSNDSHSLSGVPRAHSQNPAATTHNVTPCALGSSSSCAEPLIPPGQGCTSGPFH